MERPEEPDQRRGSKTREIRRRSGCAEILRIERSSDEKRAAQEKDRTHGKKSTYLDEGRGAGEKRRESNGRREVECKRRGGPNPHAIPIYWGGARGKRGAPKTPHES